MSTTYYKLNDADKRMVRFDLAKHDKQIRAKAIKEIKSKAHCDDVECWDCAFGDAEAGCLLKEIK